MKYQVGDYLIDTALYRISTGGVVVPVEPKVFDLLVYLLRHRDRVLSREELFQQVWDGREVSDATLSNHIKIARKALGDNGELQRTIQTIRGRGYQFVAPVSEIPGGADRQGSSPVPPPAGAAATPMPPATRRTARGWRLPLVIGALLLAVGLAGWRMLADPPAPGPPYVLAVPFDVSGGAPEAWQPWADELTRQVIRDLRQISGLRVADRPSAFMFSGNKTHAYIRHQLPDVQYVLDGVVAVAGDGTLRLTVELDDLGTGQQVWTKVYPASVDNTGALQSTLAAAVSESLKVVVLEDERSALRKLRERPTGNREALHAYVEGWKYLQLYDPASLKKAIELFDRAIALDPDFFDVHLARGEAYRWLFGYYERPSDMFPEVEAALTRALQLRADSAEAMAALGLSYVMAWQWQKAWKVLNEARAKDPNLATTDLGFALYYSGLGEPALVQQSLERARANDPLNVELADWGNWALFMVGEADAARRWVTGMMEKHPNFGVLASGAGVGAYIRGETELAVRLAEKGHTLEPTPVVKIMLAQAYGFAGRKEKVEPLLKEADSVGTYTCPYESAAAYLSIGNMEKAIQKLRAAVPARSNCLIFLRVDPRMEPLRQDPRYRPAYLQLLADVGLDDASWKSYPR